MDNLDPVAVVNSRISEMFGSDNPSFAELIHAKNQANKNGDIDKQLLITIFIILQFYKKNALTAAQDWLTKADEIVSNLAHASPPENILSLFRQIKTTVNSNSCRKVPNSSLVETLMEGLSQKPMTTIDLLEFLFDGIEIESAENRLKNLLHRARKQFPNEIVKTNGFYSVPKRQNK